MKAQIVINYPFFFLIEYFIFCSLVELLITIRRIHQYQKKERSILEKQANELILSFANYLFKKKKLKCRCSKLQSRSQKHHHAWTFCHLLSSPCPFYFYQQPYSFMLFIPSIQVFRFLLSLNSCHP